MTKKEQEQTTDIYSCDSGDEGHKEPDLCCPWAAGYDG